MGAFQYGDAGECEREDSYDERERGWFLQPFNEAGPFGPENGLRIWAQSNHVNPSKEPGL